MIDRQLRTNSETATSAADILERYRAPIERGLRDSLESYIDPVYDMLRYHLGLDEPGSNGGKALRPTLCLLVCEALGVSWEAGLPAAASLELIHNFSLIHDDIQDGDLERRHRPTVWSKWGVPMGINAGDAMFCLATLNLRHLRPAYSDTVVVEVMELLHEATREMIDGQYLDMSFESMLEVPIESYLNMIACKTGALLRASVETGALLAGAGATVRHRCRRFGEVLGRLFQIRDDMLGVWGTTELTGKAVGADILRKKKSLPIVMALAHAAAPERATLLDIYRQEALSNADVDRVQELFSKIGVQERVQDLANEAHAEASVLVESINFDDRGRSEMLTLVNFLLERDH
ncbi:MAG: polyprenyl synthetase family protein [Chloroflexi bacterium]|nr:polyprenyl synthetase family protein [Chloroflexota bacterium]